MTQAEQALILAVTAENAALKNRTLYLYQLCQDEEIGYDTYDSCIVIAESEEEAVKIHPMLGPCGEWWSEKNNTFRSSCWASHPKNISIECLGVPNARYNEPCMLLASFNAG